MAVSGFCLFGFVAGHLAGNLQVFLGPEAINRYGHFLQSNPELIWPARLSLLALIGLHIWSAAKLTQENRAARPVAYGEYKPVGSSYASRTMLMTGLIVASFIIYHLLHFTIRTKGINLTGQDFVTFKDAEYGHDIYRMIIVGFKHPLVSLFYLVGVGLLCFHLSHGISAMFQSIGWKNETYRPLLDKAARLIGLVLFLGYASIPAAVLLGILKEATK
jgi:succinate dehydrogenase / fumarate reductase cytochrome b subunit